MSVREFVILGSSAQVPTRQRNHNGYFLRWDDEGFLFDPGEGTQRQMIFADIAASSITNIAITHFHGDHCLGLAGVVQRLSLDRIKHTVRAYFPRYGEGFFEHLVNASAFQTALDLERNSFDEAGILVNNNKFTLSAMRLEHSIESWGYRLQEHDSRTMNAAALRARKIAGPSVGLLKKQGYLDTDEGRLELDAVSELRRGQSFAFIMDTRLCENAYKLAQGVDMLVCESTFLQSEAREANAYMHLTAAQAASIARDAGVACLVLTHFSQRYTSNHAFLQEAQAIFPNTILAKDLEHIAFPKRKRSV
ncbi:MAG: ribonuclease Z [Bradymonadales bacterium]|jgi:ribonuclease Z